MLLVATAAPGRLMSGAEVTWDPARERYVALATYRRDGREVRTPVWLAALDGRWYLFTAADAGKLKRIRANGRARLAACDMRGNVRSGWRDAHARIVHESALIERAHSALCEKYGLQMRIGDFFAKLTGRYARRVYVELEPDGG